MRISEEKIEGIEFWDCRYIVCVNENGKYIAKWAHDSYIVADAYARACGGLLIDKTKIDPPKNDTPFLKKGSPKK